ncbi:MAG: type II secretion system protein [Pseudomonadota bacterium]
MKANQSGFTLIELIVVITILGILSAFALPRFAALQTDARMAKMNGALGSIKAAAVLSHSIQLTQQLAPGASVLMEGSSITMANGYPLASNVSIGHAAGFVNVAGVSFDDFVLAPIAGGGVFTVTPDAGHPLCAVTYTEPAAGGAPTYSNGGVSTLNC